MMTLLFALVTVTHAAPVKFCLLYNVDLDDAEGVGDDYIDSNATNYHARGAWVRVKVTGGSGVWTGYLNEGPSSPGCTPTLNLALGVDHTITLKSENVVRGNYLYLYDDDSTEDPYYAIPSTTYQPPFGGETKTYILQTEDHWSNIAVASWAAWHADTGPMDPITMYMDSECPWLEGTCCDDGNLVYVGGHVLKALLAHNLGHCVWTAVGGPNFATEEGGLYGDSGAV